MRITPVVVVLTFILTWPAAAAAQNFGLVESAETINKGNFKVRINPLVVFGKDGEDSRIGVAALAGYGITSRVDLEGGVAFFDGVTFFGGNAEFWLVQESPLDVSVIGGLHRRTGDQTVDLTGIDLAFLASGHVSPRLEVFGGLELAFEGIGDAGDFKTVHLVPGVEYRISDRLDFVASVGIAVNDAARHYLTGGFAIYWR